MKKNHQEKILQFLESLAFTMDQISLERNYAEKSHEWPFMTLAVQCQYLRSLAPNGLYNS